MKTRRSFPPLRRGYGHACLPTLVNTLLQVKQSGTSCCQTGHVWMSTSKLFLMKHFNGNIYSDQKKKRKTKTHGVPCRPAQQSQPITSLTPPPILPQSKHIISDSGSPLVSTPTHSQTITACFPAKFWLKNRQLFVTPCLLQSVFLPLSLISLHVTRNATSSPYWIISKSSRFLGIKQQIHNGAGETSFTTTRELLSSQGDRSHDIKASVHVSTRQPWVLDEQKPSTAVLHSPNPPLHTHDLLILY